MCERDGRNQKKFNSERQPLTILIFCEIWDVKFLSVSLYLKGCVPLIKMHFKL